MLITVVVFSSKGLLSSFGELQHALSSKPQIKLFEPETTVMQEYQGFLLKYLHYISI